MKRDFSLLDGKPFDLLVVGGGIYGSWTAYDAALRGLRVAVIEQGDWASGTSSASSKLIHGGLRYLEHGRIGLVRKSLDERRRLARLGPHRVRPLRLALPIRKGDPVGVLRMRVGLWLYDLLAGRDSPVEKHRVHTAREMVERHGLSSSDLRCGITFGDCQTDDARFVLEIVDGAVSAGAVAVNHARATRLIVRDRRVIGAEVRDLESERTIELRARVTANCSGPWCNRLTDGVAEAKPDRYRTTRGVHLVLPAMATREAFLIMSAEDRRIVFLLPWYGRTLLGTTDTDYGGEPGAETAEPEDVHYLLARANGLFERPLWSASDVIASFAGLRTLAGDRKGSPSSVSREWHLGQPIDGLLSSVGGKFTSARAEAGRIVDRTQRLLGRARIPSPTAARLLPWAPQLRYRAWKREMIRDGLQLGLDEEMIASCARRYGTRVERLFDRVRQAPDLGRRIVPDLPFCMAEVVHAVHEEMARTLHDVLRRRVPLLLLSRLDDHTLREIADRAGAVLGWSAPRRREEVECLRTLDGDAAALRQPV